MDYIDITLWITLGFIVIFGVGFAIWQMTRFKHLAIIKDLTNGSPQIRIIKARDYKDKEGIDWWILAGENDKTKRKVEHPPSKARLLSLKGKIIAEGYRDADGNLVWVEDKTRSIDDVVKDPLTTKQRLILISAIRKAEARKGFSWKQNIPVIVSIAALVLIILALMVFWGDIAKPVLDAKQMDQEIMTIQNENLKILERIENKVQYIEGEILDLKNKEAKGVDDAPN